jgi:hypothetical protein
MDLDDVQEIKNVLEINELTVNTTNTLNKKDLEESLKMNQSELKKNNNSFTKLHNFASNLIIPKENMTNFFNRLASSKKLPDLMPAQKLESKISKHRDTALLDATLNVNEILNEKYKNLLSEENIADKFLSFKEPEICNFSENPNLNFSIDENICENITYKETKTEAKENKSTLYCKKLSLKTDNNTLNNEQPKLKLTTIKKSTGNNIKAKLNTPIKNTLVKSSNQKIKNENSINVLNKKINVNKTNATKPINSKFLVKTPMKSNKINIFTPKANKKETNSILKSNFSSTISNNKSFNSKSLNTSAFNEKKNSKDFNSSISYSKKPSAKLDFPKRNSGGDRKSFLSAEFNVIEEYDYLKILNELRQIFGEELEYFDENSKL